MVKKNINKKLGLPYGKMKKIVICFDIDGTLRNNKVENDVIANENIRDLLRILKGFKNTEIVVWSGSGKLYARQIGRMLHIDQWVDGYASKTEHESIKPDIVIDDIQDTAIGNINLIVREK
jgi:phosphoserine phosphatase